MPYNGFTKFLLVIGFLSLLHAAYSAAQHRTYLRDTDQEKNVTFLPLDIIIQSVTSLFLIIYSLLHVVGDFKEIRATIDLQAKSWETLSNIPSFYIFNHRGKSLLRGSRPDVYDELENRINLMHRFSLFIQSNHV